MSREHHLVYLHGRGSGAARDRSWLHGLARSLRRCGFDITTDELEQLKCAPAYTHLLESNAEFYRGFRLPDPPERPPAPEAVRSAFVDNRDRLEEVVGEGYPSTRTGQVIGRLADLPGTTSVAVKKAFEDVERYCSDRGRRHTILHSVLDQLPESGRCVVIAHSLGSVVALDLLAHWPEELHVDLLVTVGSPAGLDAIRPRLEGRGRTFPYEVVSGWINVFDSDDVVTGGRGLGVYYNRQSGTPKVVDHQVENGRRTTTHAVDRYLDHVLVGGVIGRQLRDYLRDRSASKVALPDDPHGRALWLDLALQQRFRTETRSRTKDARKRARMKVADEHARIAAVVALDLPQEHHLEQHLDELVRASDLNDDARRKLLVQLRATPAFAPFHIELESRTIRPSLVAMARHVGAATQNAVEVDQAVRKAREAQKESPSPVGGAAFAMAVVATRGSALLTAPTFTGAATTTSGLAALGSLGGGGMTAGLFVTAGTSAASPALAATATQMLSPAQLEAEIVKIHAEALLAKWHGDQDRVRALDEQVAIIRDEARRMAREHGHVDTGGTKSAAAKAYVAKRATAHRALKHLREQG